MKKIVGLSALAVVLAGANSAATMVGFQTLELDFRDVSISTRAQWSNRDKLNLTKEGLGFSGEPAATIDVSVESLQPFAIGYSWRPAQSAQIDVEVLPRLNAITLANGQTSMPYSGDFYVRYGPDARHWSSWQIIEAQQATGENNIQRRFSGQVSVPQKERAAYQGYLDEYFKQDVPWTSDEEAAVKWILRKDPSFFSKSLPFIGYLQVLFETQVSGGRRLEHVKVGIGYAVSGLASIPKNKKVQEERDGPWRFRGE